MKLLPTCMLRAFLFPAVAVASLAIVPLPAADQAGDKAIRIKAGLSKPHTDEAGVVWQADSGFSGGDVVGREDNLAIANTRTPSLYRTEHYSMTSFTWKLPNGRYTVKLHFAETFEGITGKGERVFSYQVEGKEFKDFDIFATTGGANRAYVETVEVEIKDGQLDIAFTPKVENPEINAIEIIPVK
ncbi:MAG: malectin [Verrucomicrobia bacterium]|nr:malectin [Verrucomicrobiota bacterium]